MQQVRREPTRVLFLSFDEVPSYKGASTHILAGLRVPIQHIDVTLVTLGSATLPAAAQFRHHPVTIHERNYLRRALLFRRTVEQLLTRDHWDLIHFRGPFEGLPAVRSSTPTIYELNAVPSVELPYHYGDLPQHFVEKLVSWETECLLGASQVICPSSRLRQFILQHTPAVPASKVLVLPNGYDEPAYSPHRREFTAPARGVYLGTLTPWQGVQWSLRTFRELAPDFSLDIFAPYQKVQWRRMLRRIHRYGLQETVRLFPALPRWELSAQLRQYDFGFAPLLKTARNAEQGCCPLKILDYLAHGLPVVAPDLFVVREIIRTEGYPFLFTAGNRLSLSHSLLSLKNTLTRGEAFETRALLGNHLTWEEYGARLLALYRSTVPS